MSEMIYNPPLPHNHGRDLPVDYDRRQGALALCSCGLVIMSVDSGFYGDFWRPVRSWPFDREARRVLRTLDTGEGSVR
ncbi:MAG: hypothetical protein ACRDQA_26665 [Nocardioidaceae bacterium]